MAGPVYLLDTNVILHLVRGNALGKRLASVFGLLDTVYRPLVSIVTHGELLVMADRNQWGGRVSLWRFKQHWITWSRSISTNRAVLRAYVEVQRYSRQLSGPARVLNANEALRNGRFSSWIQRVFEVRVGWVGVGCGWAPASGFRLFRSKAATNAGAENAPKLARTPGQADCQSAAGCQPAPQFRCRLQRFSSLDAAHIL
jgi:predicted nucleic acid-binding protein